MTGLWVFSGIMLALFAAAVWLTKLAAKAQTSKSIGDLMNEEHAANEDLKKHNEVLRDTPEHNAARRVSDKWTRPE